MPSRDIPSRPSLEHYKKQAKDLVKASNAASPEAIARIRGYLPRLRGLPDSEIRRAQFKLSDAQLIIAREHAFENWSKFARHIQMLDPAQATRVQVDGVELAAEVTLPEQAVGLVLFAAASSSSRHDPKRRAVAEVLNRGGLGTILADLFTEEEELADIETEELRFDLRLLSRRIAAVADWVSRQSRLRKLHMGYLGSATAAAAVLLAAAEPPSDVRAVVSIAGRPDLAGPWLGKVQAPTLFIVGANDTLALGFTSALIPLSSQSLRKLEALEGVSQLFDEPAALEKSAALALDWFRRSFQQ
jgi:putative phosphoribosyl transferase